MKKVFILTGLLALNLSLFAQADEQPDSLKNVQLEEVVVSATRAGKNTPMAYSNVSQSDIKKENAAKNIPAILQNIPSLVWFSEDGSGVGNTSMRIRGTDATRINVTLNGMPLNNPESQEVYWVNLPDLSSSLQSIQVQRGVGTSTNGAAAFGASISMKTVGARSEAYGEASTSIGSYNTFSSTIAAGTGILKNGLSLDARYSRNLGDGYIRNGFVNHGNLHVSLSHYTDNQLIKLSYINGRQKTGITWEGISPEDMEKHGRRYNPAGKYKDDAGNTHYYGNETDNYFSHIVQLLFTRELNKYLSLNANLSYNNGFGYYENYRQNRKFSDFGLQPQVVNGTTYSRTDFIRQKLMRNDFYVANLALTYTKNALNWIFGGMYSFYDGDHYGKLPWIKHNQNIQKDYEWYRNVGKKGEFNFFTKVDYQLNEKISLFGDIQYRNINYRFSGIDDDMVNITRDFKYNFFNPKAGVFYRIDNYNNLYASVAVGQREPLRTDLKESIKGGGGEDRIKPEKMIDYELGYRFSNENGVILGVNLYYMDYKNQMVQTGKLNNVGYKLMENVKDSYRTGIELEASVPFINNKFRFDANATLSQNKIKNYTAYFDLYDDNENWNEVYIEKDGNKIRKQTSKELGTTNISYSPDVTGTASLTYQPTSALSFNLLGKYVGKQYLDNTSDDAKSINGYFVSNFSAGYTFNKTPIGKVALQVFVNNLFNKEYIANGWAATEAFEKDGSSVNWIGYYPQATRNYMARVTISF
ncbi:MAG: TonB-dependent receptor [Bacteroidia bacterium]|nr:TonB-dependent receptor [Bacteroidia bacterium]